MSLPNTATIGTMKTGLSEMKATLTGHVLTPGRQLFGIDYFGSIFLPSGNLHAPSHHRESTPAGELEISRHIRTRTSTAMFFN